MLRNIIFDCGGVICEFDVERILLRYFAPEDVGTARDILFRDWATIDAGDMVYEDYVAWKVPLMPERLQAQTGRFFDGWYKTQPPIEDVWALAARLKARGYGVYLLSNAPTVYHDCIADVFPVIKMFDGMVISAPIKMTKPNRDIFEYTLQKFGLKAEECLFVDDVQANVDGAKACGLDGYRFDGDADALARYIENA
ncbi:MAG: HAD family phosphatase [Clostridiales bacterium]|nr:HAD family phosphatase [Clostridiales bacterium]